LPQDIAKPAPPVRIDRAERLALRRRAYREECRARARREAAKAEDEIVRLLSRPVM
jgi:hypothetical protein